MPNIVKIDTTALKERWADLKVSLGIPGGNVPFKLTDTLRKVHRNVLISSLASLTLSAVHYFSPINAKLQKIKLPFLGSDAQLPLWLVSLFLLITIAYYLWRLHTEHRSVVDLQHTSDADERDIAEKVQTIDYVCSEILTRLNELSQELDELGAAFVPLADRPVSNENWNKTLANARSRIESELNRIVTQESKFVDPDATMVAFEQIDRAVLPVSKTDLDATLKRLAGQMQSLQPLVRTQLADLSKEAGLLLRLRTDLIGGQRRDYIFHWRGLAWAVGIAGIIAAGITIWRSV